MTSAHFDRLSSNLDELKRIYLASEATTQPPNAEHQEMARAFLVFAHAELEWYAERICIDLSDLILHEAKNGRFSSSTLALLTFSTLENLNGGDSLGGKKAGARMLTSRVGDAQSKHKQVAEANEGIREKHLSKLFVPLGLTGDQVDSTWLIDLDTLGTSRGAFAHMSRSESRASPLAANPSEAWGLCHRIVWGSPATSSGSISSIEELDQWFLATKSAFNKVTVVTNQTLWERVFLRIRRLLP